MALDSIGSDLSKITIKPVTQVNDINNNVNVVKPTATVSAPQLEKDGANVNSNKGKIPASGSIFDGNNKSSGADKIISQYSNDKKQLQSFLSALESVNLADGIDNESDDVMNELLTLGFDITVENGKITIKDNDGNSISPEDFNSIKDNLKNTLKRTISNLGSGNSAGVSAAGATQNVSATANKPPAMMSAAQEQEMLKVLADNAETNKHIKEVSNPLKAKLETSIKEYESKMSQAEAQSQKIDMSISQIISLRGQAEALVQKGKTQPLSATEKKQLLSLTSTIQLKQKEMQSYQQGNELLMQQVDQVYSQFSDGLSASEKNTKEAMQSALKAKISGQSLDVRQNFLASMSEDIFKLTSNMSEDELQKTMGDTGSRVKLLASTNKLIDKMSGAKKLSDFDGQELDTLWAKFKIKAVEENGKVEFYYYKDTKSDPQKVSKEDLKQMRVDLNNVVSSPQLFTLARASGQISIAYDKGMSEKAEEVSGAPVQITEEKKKDKKDVSNNSEPQETKKFGKNAIIVEDPIQTKESKRLEVKSIDNSIEQRRQEEKYHEKQIKNIYENRREVNKFIENKRNAQAEERYDLNQKRLHNK